MKNIILFFLLFQLGCANMETNNYQFQPLECNPEEMPKWDGNKVTFLDDAGNPVKDTIIGRVEKRRTVFKPCREIIYQAEFKTAAGNLISKSRIKMMALGRRWQFQPEKQDEISIQYEFTQADFDRNQQHQLNRGMLTDKWTGTAKEGIIENVEEVWMHPFRSNQYNFTEVAPFPQVKFPLRIGKSWTSSLNIQEGWGDWANTRKYSEYEVTNKENLRIPFGPISDCWKIKSKSRFELGESTFEYWFNEELGFVQMNYKNYGQQTLDIVLIEVTEK
ncbi:MAG: hypothetical protein AAF960_05025 [Bacteroidota bacterium]